MFLFSDAVGLARRPLLALPVLNRAARRRRASRLRRQRGKDADGAPSTFDPAPFLGLDPLEARLLLAAAPTFDLRSLAPANGGDGSAGITFFGIDPSDAAGRSVASAGDVNGDGIDDVIIGAHGADGAGNGKSNSGEVYVVFGRVDFVGVPTINLSSLDGTTGFALFGADTGDGSGLSVDGAGDVNGDGYDDLIIGAYAGDGLNGSAQGAGEAHVVFGRASFEATPTISLGSLDGTNGFTMYGSASGGGAGHYALGAGDVNNDGFDDVVVTYIRTTPNSQSIVIFGQASFASVPAIELGSFEGVEGFIIAEHYYAWPIVAAGDVNGDGFADLIGGDRLPLSDQSHAFVLFGGDHFDAGTPVDVTSLNGTDGFYVTTIGSYNNNGKPLSGAGDVNGDGFDDVIIGASDKNAAFVVFGKASFVDSATIDSALLNGVNGFKFTIDGYSGAGYAVNAAGDVDGDGIDDLIIGTPNGDGPNDSRYDAGESYIVYGRPSFGASIAASSLNGYNGFTLYGVDGATSNGDNSGYSVASAGDFNNDGLADFMIGAPAADGVTNTKSNAGEVYLVFGKRALPEVGVRGNDVEITDGDTTPDIADHTDFGIVRQGTDPIMRTFTVRNTGSAVLNIQGIVLPTGYSLVEGLPSSLTIDASNTFTVRLDTVAVGVKSGQISILSDDPDENPFNFSLTGNVQLLPHVVVLGNGVTIVDGDATPTVVDHTNFGITPPGGPTISRTFTIRNDGNAALTLSNLTVPAGFSIVEGLVDTLEPGESDTITIHLESNSIGSKSGQISFTSNEPGSETFNFSIRGQVALSPASVDLASLLPSHGGDGSLGFTLFGEEAGDQAGAVAIVGDLNGDGFDDMIIGASLADGPSNSRLAAGETYVVFGRASFDGVPTIELSSLDGIMGFKLLGIDADDNSGNVVAGAGDVNGDGFADLIIDASAADGSDNLKPASGETYVVFGKTSFAATPVIDLASLDGANGFTLLGINYNDNSGAAVAGAGDVNGDGFDDLLIGAHAAPNADLTAGVAGQSYVVFGKATFNSTLDLSTLDGLNGFTVYGIDIDDRSGWALDGAGDVNGDGFADILIGSFFAASVDNDRFLAGESYVIFGRASFEDSAQIDLATLDGDIGFTLFGADSRDFSGRAVAMAGDVNGDGFDDLLIGAPSAHSLSNGREDAGESYIVFGKADFDAAIDLRNLGLDGVTLLGWNQSDASGLRVAAAGDVNGDGFADVLIGAPGADGHGNSRTSAGDSYLIFGKASFATTPTIELHNLNGVSGFIIYGAEANDGSGYVGQGGDVNGDGLDDLIIGAYNADGPSNTRLQAGEAYVLFGRPLTVPLATVLGNDVIIKDNDTTPSTADFTDFGSVVPGGQAISRSFTVRNDGLARLDLSSLSVPAGFTVTQGLPASIAPGDSVTLIVQLDSDVMGLKQGNITFNTSDLRIGWFSFAVTGTVLSPEVTVQGNGLNIIDGDISPSLTDHTAFGSAAQGDPGNTRTFTVRNDGEFTLTLADLAVPQDYEVIEGLAAALAPGQSDAFTVRLNTDAPGTFNGQISFTSNDVDESTFNFAITGTILLANTPELSVLGNGVNIADGDSTPSTNDLTDFGTSYTDTDFTRTFTVRNDGTASLTIADLTVPAGFIIVDGISSSLAPGESDTFTVQIDTTTTGTKSGSIKFTSNDSDENEFSFSVTGVVIPTAPEVTVLGNGLIIADNDFSWSHNDHTLFPEAVEGSTHATRTFTVRNDGNAPLTLTNLRVPDGFIVTEELAATLEPGESDTFTIARDTAVVGTMSANVIFATNDSDEPSFAFSISGAVTPLPVARVRVVGNGYTIFDDDLTPRTDDFTDFGSVPVGGSLARTFTIHNEGNATLLIADLTVPAGFIIVEGIAQTIAAWSSDTFTIALATDNAGTSSGELSFTTNDGTKPLFNFAITGTVTVPLVTVLGNDVEIVDGDTTPATSDDTDMGIATPGDFLTRTYTVRNDGAATLTLADLTAPVGFSVVEGLSASLAPGESDTFTIQLDEQTPGVKVGQVTFNTNDPNTGNFDFTVRANIFDEVAGVSFVTIEDMGDSPSEGDADSQGVIRIRRNAPKAEPLTVKFTRSGKATYGSGSRGDYTLSVGGIELTTNAVTIPADASFVDINIHAVNDTRPDRGETVLLKLASSSSYQIHKASADRIATVTIVDDEPTVSITALAFDDADSVAQETNTGDTADTAVFRVFRTGLTDAPLDVKFSTSGTAKRSATGDYIISVGGVLVTSKTITIPEGASFVDVVINPVNDARVENAETVTLRLRGDSSRYTLAADKADQTATVTIEDNEPTLSVEALVADASEPGGQANAGVLRISRTGTTGEPLDVTFKVNGTARAGRDYVKLGSKITIPAGASFVDIEVEPLSDAIVEAAELVTLTVAKSKTYRLDESAVTASVTIADGAAVAGADLVVLAMAQSAKLFGLSSVNTDLKISATIKNQGTLDAVDVSQVRVLLSTNRTVGDGDIDLGVLMLSPLAAGKTGKAAGRFNITGLGLDESALGRYFVILVIDSTLVIDETIEDNNTFASRLANIVIAP